MGKSRISNLSKKAVGIFALPLAAIPVAASLGTTPAHAQEDKVTLSIATQCNFANTGGAVAQDGTYSATGLNGQEATFENGGRHLFNVACNNLSGYTIRAYATDLVNQELNNISIPFTDFADYNATGDRAKWTANITDGKAGAVFGHSSSDTRVIKEKDGPSAESGDEFSVTYKAYIGKTTTAGTYEGDAVYTLIMNPLTPTTYTWHIYYHADGSAAVPPTQSGEVSLGETATATLSNLVPVKDGYHLAGWDTNSTADTIVYTPGQSIDISQTNNVINLYAVWDNNVTAPDIWFVRYDANGGTNAPNILAVMPTPGSDFNATVSSGIPYSATTAPYGRYFLGWSTNPEATTPDPGFARGQTPTITLNESNPSVTLYAVWGEQRLYFQTIAATSETATTWCQSLTEWTSGNNTQYTVYDQRDEKGYLVRRLADGNCWMVQNLALDSGETEETRRTITPIDSDVTSDYKLPISNRGPSGSWSDNNTQYMWNGTHQNATQDTAVTSSNTATANTGAYYSFLTATAGTGTGSSGDTNQSICPKGWKLPTGGATGKQYNTLASKYSAGSTFNTAFNVAFTGVCNSNNCPNANSNAYYWSSSIGNASNGYYLNTFGSNTSPSGGTNKHLGGSVRCVLIGSPSS